MSPTSTLNGNGNAMVSRQRMILATLVIGWMSWLTMMIVSNDARMDDMQISIAVTERTIVQLSQDSRDYELRLRVLEQRHAGDI